FNPPFRHSQSGSIYQYHIRVFPTRIEKVTFAHTSSRRSAPGTTTVDVLNPAYSDSIINAILSPGGTSWVAMEPHCRNHHSGKDGRFYLTGNDGVWDC